MEQLVDIDKLIKDAKAQGVKLGKGDPYNRLRYYTKIGWLPHMTRKKTKGGDIKGHYPKWVLDRLVRIQELKEQGYSNDEISDKINTRNKLHDMYAKVNSDTFRNKLISYVSVSILIIILLVEMEVIDISKSKDREVLQYTESLPTQIFDSGISFVPANKRTIFIKNESVEANSKVYVTFNQNFSPATRYWVSRIEPQEGFYVELDAPVFDNVEFSWWISN